MIYTVKQGDTLSKIARDVLGNMEFWPAIVELNDIKNPDLIYPGQQLILPDKLEPIAPQQQAGFGVVGWVIAIGLLGGIIFMNPENRKKVNEFVSKAKAIKKKK